MCSRSETVTASSILDALWLDHFQIKLVNHFEKAQKKGLELNSVFLQLHNALPHLSLR